MAIDKETQEQISQFQMIQQQLQMMMSQKQTFQQKSTEKVILGSHSTCYSVEGQQSLAKKAVTNLLGSIK